MSFAKRWSSALLLVAAMSQSVMAAPGLQLKMSGPSQVTDADNFSVTATLNNIGDEDLKLYKDPNGVLSTTPAQTFKVSNANDGSIAPFVGIVVKWSFKQNDFVDLPVGGSIDVSHSLSLTHEFNSGGPWTVTPSTTFYYQNSDGNPVKIQADLVNSHTAKIAGDFKARSLEKRREGYKSTQMMKRSEISASTTHCTNDQSSEITQSIFYSSVYVASAEKYLTMHNATSDRYKAWFGEFSEDNHALVLSHYTKIRTSDVKTYVFDCTCDIDEAASTYAFVYPEKFGHVYLCGQYMSANVSGTDSKAGTIVHESTHFLANGGTEDLAYGHADAQALAVQNATAACNNADSHEYFAENATPWYA